MQNKNPTNPQGIDISSYQEGLNMNAVKATGIQVVYIKATEGTNYMNPLMQEFYQQAKAQGLKVGFYHFFNPSIDAVQQARYFASAIQGLTYDCLPVLDVEVTNDYGPIALSMAIHSCLNEIAYLTGHKAMLYTYTSFAKSNLAADYVGTYPLWIADYNGRDTPGDNPIWDTWAGFQYSDTGNIGGINVDLDEFTNDIFLEGDGKVTAQQAINYLKSVGVISDTEYWLKVVDTTKYFDAFVINAAQKLEAKKHDS